ncbi:MAG: tryptophan synthase subunit alpha [Crocinitomicaceae bacterium]|nr:tryptophan synthase subunit alpha [Crocinitomicaceae bacterium]
MNLFNKNKKQLSIFITAGYPMINSINEQLNLLEEHGVDFVEVGIPFSDPLADGPVIQESSSVAINNGMNLSILFEQLKDRNSTLPILLMGYLNPVLNFGITKFLKNCNALNITSVILPDLSLEIYERLYRKQFEAYGVYPSFLITPSTDETRVKRTADICKNSFVYLVSNNATTGGQKNIGEKQLLSYRQIKTICGKTPVFVGFGIQSKSDVEAVQSVVDGAIIGSSYLKKLARNEHEKYLSSICS